MRFIYLIIGSVLGVLYILKLSKGKQYESMVEVLDSEQFPLKDLYTAGFAWSETSIFQFSGKIPASLKAQAGLVYDPLYSEYYGSVVWAQTISMTHLFLAMTFLLAGFLVDMASFILLVGLFMSVFVAVYFLQNMKNVLAERTQECEGELPEVVSTMAILVSSGMILREAWTMIANNGEGKFYELMREAGENMQNGYSDTDAIFLFGKSTNSAEIKKFTSALIQSIERGGSDLPSFLSKQSSELWQSKRQRMLQLGEKAATKLLMPILLIFVGVIIIVITAAFAGSMF